MKAINRMLMHRFARHGLLTAVFFMLLVTVWSLNLDFLISNQRKTAQQRYLEEQKLYPSVFSHVVSTLDRIAVPPSHDNRTIREDPRFEGKQGSKIPRIYLPYPDYSSQAWQDTHRGPFVPCVGPRGKLLNESLDDQVGVYVGVPDEFPSPMFGSHEAVGFDAQVSFDRYTRYGAYGFGEEESFVTNWMKPSKVKWDDVDWSDLQRQCYDRNAARFSQKNQKNDGLSKAKQHIAPESRTAVLMRTYVGKKYTENDLQVIRSMITELSLQSGGEYSVFLLLHVKNSDLPIDQVEVHQEVLKDNIPEEFWNMTILWNVPMVAARYPNLDRNVIDVHHAQWLSVQHFALQYPDFDFVWNWEVDARFTGHHYEFANKVAEFARKQPRRGMWERNSRFYIPAVHGAYDSDFRKFVELTEDEAVWGPLPLPINDRELVGPSPPVPSPHQDSYAWGVGEEADYIGFLPIFHPIGTDWVIKNEVSGYLGADTPRRASLITHSRLSRRLLLAMDAENLAGRHMGSEMFPVTTALHHGLKAITAPHPIYSDKNLPPESVDKWFNSGVNGRAGSTKNSPFSWGRESRFKDLSWYYRANLPGRLYWNFLGWRKEGTGGKLYETLRGRVCLPSILFHPIKDVRPDADSTHYQFDFELGYVAVR